MSSRSQSGQGRTASGSSSSSGRNRAVESAVTRLLVAIKQLLESLTNWSLLKIDENQVSDVYVRLGNDFNQAVAAFASFNIDMSELMMVPDDLRNVLEQCLAEDATPENLELYLPHVRQIITGLLQGLREKQSIYSKMTRRGSEHTNHERNESRSSRGDRASRKTESGHRPQGSRIMTDADRLEREGSDREGVRRSTHSSSSRKKEGTSNQPRGTADEGEFVGGFATPRSDAPKLPELPFGEERPVNAFDGARRHRSQHSLAGSAASPSPASTPQSVPPPQLPPPDGPPPPAPSQPAVPASVKRYSLVDKPMPPPTSPPPTSPPPVIVEPASPPADQTSAQDSPAMNQETEVTPAMANSLAALQRGDMLERRASKRFSTFHISKMTGGSGATRERSLRSHPHRRSLAAGGPALTPGDLAVLAEDEEEEGEPVREQESVKREKPISRTATPDPAAPPVPKLPPHFKELSPEMSTPQTNSSPHHAGDPSKITVFLQVGREVKKSIVDRNISMNSLRMLFMDKFAYSSGQGNFPAVYIRDPSSGVQYELEDMEEISEKCLLILNIEPLDQIKEHIDTQISALSNDIKELKSTVANVRFSQPAPPPSIVTEMADNAPINQPSERQFTLAARRLSRFVSPAMNERPHSPVTPTAAEFSPIHAQMTGQSLQPQLTGGSVLSEYSSRIVTDLKTQFDEVQNLRRDLGVMRQLYTGFIKQTKDSLGALRKQTQSVKQLANTEIGGARTFIITGKKKLDERTQNVLTDIEKLLDTVEAMKEDVLKKQVTPKEFIMKNMKREMDKAQAELESLREHIKTIKPMWKKTWEEELQNIVEEQQFLTHQEQFLEDLIEDHKAAVEIYGHIEKVINLRGPKLNGAAKGRPMVRQRSFPGGGPVDGGAGSIGNVMMEIRAAAGDSEKRMEAIKASEQNREKELASRSDDLQAELTEFVGQKKLKLTGGAEEADRVRQKRSEATLRAMFNTPSSVASTPVSEMPRTPPAT